MNDPGTPPPPAPRPRSPISRRAVLLLVAGAVALLAVVGAALYLSASRLYRSVHGKVAGMNEAVEEFLQAGARGDAAAGRSLLDRGSGIPPREVERLFADRRDLFEGYESFVQTGYTVTAGKTTSGALSGRIRYRGGRPELHFVAEMTLDGSRWKLDSLHFLEGIGHRPQFEWERTRRDAEGEPNAR